MNIMHDCPECGQACDCDSEDTWIDSPDWCEHDCEPEDEDDGGYGAWKDDHEDSTYTQEYDTFTDADPGL